jgi:uncharacterized protein
MSNHGQASHCPKCGMKLLEFTHHGIRIDQCAHCEGIWLDRGELEQISQARKGEIFSLELVGKQVRAEEGEVLIRPEEIARLQNMHYRQCPRCATGLEELRFHQVQIDHCSKCGGVWLDKGEFEQVAGVEHGFLTSLARLFKPRVLS